MAEGSSSAARVVEEQILKAAAEKVPMQLLWMEYESSDMAQVETLAPVGIEAVHLLHLLVDEYLPWSAKVEAARLIALARAQDALTIIEAGGSDQAGEADEAAGLAYAVLYRTLLSKGCEALGQVLSPPNPDPTGVRTRRASPAYGAVWKAALCGLIPALIYSLEGERVKRLASTPAADSQGIVSRATTAFLQHTTPLLVDIEALMARDDQAKPAAAERREDDMALDEWFESNSSPQAAPLRCSLVRALIDLQLVPADVCKDTPVAEALQDMELSLTAETGGREQLGQFLAQRLQGDEIDELLVKIASDYGAHHAFAQQVRQFFSTAVESSDLEALSRLCKALLDNSAIVDILLLHVTPTELLRPFAELLDKPDLGEIADHSAVLGSTLLFAQWLLQRAELAGPGTSNELAHHADFLPRFMRSTPTCVSPLGDLDAAERELVDRWIQALYDSEGISDDLMRASSPQALLRLAPLLFSQSIHACLSGVIDLETLKGGLAYFTQELLSFALPGALLWVIADVKRVPFRTLPPGPGGAAPAIATSRSVHHDVLAMFLTSDSCPTAVKQIIAPELHAALDDENAATVIAAPEVPNTAITTELTNANRCLPSPSRAAVWLSSLITASLPRQTLTSDGLERHTHLLRSLPRCEQTSGLIARHYLELLCSSGATALPESREALQRSLACTLAFDALRACVQHPRAALREWSVVQVAAWVGKLRTYAEVRDPTAFWDGVMHALKAMHLCAASSTGVLQTDVIQQLWTHVAQLMALATVQAASADPRGLVSVAPTLASAAKSGAPSAFLEPLTLVFPALSSLQAN